MEASIVFALFRHVLTTVGGAYLAKYGVDGATVDAIVGGILAIAGVGWSVAEKRQRD